MVTPKVCCVHFSENNKGPLLYSIWFWLAISIVLFVQRFENSFNKRLRDMLANFGCA